ncbi:MAG TPA: methyltransferase domain-containing protein [Candidatus Nitrosocosmicus sp.]|nr:methyltransferase domain-containing protein [Candidatus Nitrosocosmicus sp.]
MYEEFTTITKEEAEQYIQNSVNQKVRQRIAEIVGNGTVLDLGCASGIDAFRYSPKQYTGLDISEELIKLASERNPEHHFIYSEALEYLENCPKFDFIICKAVLEHQPDVETMLKLYNKMLEKCDTLLIAWHMIPDKKTEIHKLKGHFGKDIYQNEYSTRLFKGNIKKERIENYELWIIKN